MKYIIILLTMFFGFSNLNAQYDYKKDHNDPDFKIAEIYRLKSKDNGKAYPIYLELANKGNAAAMNQLGWLLYEQEYVSGAANPNHKKDALVWFHKSSEKGNGNAMYSIGWLHLQFDNTVPNDYQKATEWFQQGSAAGSARATRWFGSRVYTGVGVDLDVSRALNLWLKASDIGDPMASADLAYHYSQEKNYIEALSYFKKAYDQGYFNITDNISEIYSKGLGTEKNQKLADEWKRKPFVEMDSTK